MIIKRIWTAERKGRYSQQIGLYHITQEGWFLFGLVPLYIRDVNSTFIKFV